MTVRADSRTAQRSVRRTAAVRTHRAVRRRRRSLVGGFVVLVVVIVAAIVALGPINDTIRSITLPLRNADVIRQQASEKRLDPALIAAVIYQESKFEDRTSAAGATGLMQILPSTAQAIAKRSGGTGFVPSDLATPQVNISYGAYYLRLLIDHYGGDMTLGIAAYNAGEQNVDRWVARAGGRGRFDPRTDIPFPETRSYVSSVSEHRKEYRANYAKELGYS